MPLQEALLKKFIQETALFQIGQEILSFLDTDNYESSDTDSDSSDDIDQWEEEVILVKKVLTILDRLGSLPLEIRRPYQQPGVTETHCNAITLNNFDQKFPPGIARQRLRFHKEDILTLISKLRLPSHMNCAGNIIPSFEAFVIYLRRMAYPGRYVDLIVEADRYPQVIAEVFNEVSLWLFGNWGDLVRSLEHSLFLSQERQEVYARAVFEKGCPYCNVSHFGDGTCVRVCRTAVHQERWYCGHHKYHCFKCQVIQLPNGICFGFGPFSGSGHDSRAAQDLQLDEYTRNRLTYPDGSFYMGMYDSGYRASDVMATPVSRRRSRNDPMAAAFNREFSRIRITNEWGIGKIKKLFAFLDYHPNLKVLLSPVAVYFFNGVLMCNLHTILYGSQICSYFNLDPPTIDEYLSP